MPDVNDTTCPLETRLRRFLYIGKEKPVYQPGNWFVHKYYEVQKLSSVSELASNPEKFGVITFLIHEAFLRKLVATSETLMFAMAVSAHQNDHELKEKVYTAVPFICVEPEDFILFNKFWSQVSKKEGNSKGGGKGWRRSVKTWYDRKTPEELAKIVTWCNGRYGWKHKDILKLAHYKTEDKCKNLVIEYILFGMKKLKEKHANEQLSEDQEKILQDLDLIEEFKHCEDQVKAARLAESLHLTLNHVPGHLLKSKEVWEALVPSMSIEELLQSLQRIHNLTFFEGDSTVMVSKVLDVLSEQNLKDGKVIHPATFLIALRDYENSGKPLSFEKRKVHQNSKRPPPTPPKPNKKIVDALTKMLNHSFSHLKEIETKVHYMVTINMSKAMIETGCWHCSNVTAAEAGCLIALSLLRAEKDVTVAIFTSDGIRCVELNTDLTFSQATAELKKFESDVETIDLSKPMAWAAEEKKSIDVFINIVDQVCQKSDTSEAGIKAYRTSMNQPNAKLVNCAMCVSGTYDKETYDKYSLTICGFDKKVPKVIEAFARSFF